MGMYDSFHFEKPIKCPEGHPLDDLQSKDLNCNMDDYYVKDDRVYVRSRADEDKNVGQTWRVAKGTLVITRTECLPVAGIADKIVHVYTSCRMCPPVFTAGSNSFLGHVSEHHPWCEWTLTILDSKITKIVASNVESRSTLRKKLLKDGAKPLLDTDHIARKALAKWKADRL